MMRFRLGQWLWYRRAAKGRHGVHSPFVFHLIENALRPDISYFPPLPAEIAAAVPTAEKALLRRLLAYFGPQEWWQPAHGKTALPLAKQPERSTGNAPLPCRRIMYLPATAAAWKALADEPEFRIREDDVLVLSQPHRSAADLAHWKTLQHGSGCTLSLDFLRCGLLLFRPEFREVQHLVLKHPG